MCAPSHLGDEVEGRRERQDVRVLGILQDRDSRPREHERPADVDVLHQVVLLRLQVERAREVDDARVVDDDVDAAELALGLQDRLGHVVVVAHVADDRQRVAARGADLLGGRVDRSLELRVRGVGLREQGDVRAVPRRAQGDGEADAAAAAGHQNRLAGERLVGHCGSSCFAEITCLGEVTSLCVDRVCARREHAISRVVGQRADLADAAAKAATRTFASSVSKRAPIDAASSSRFSANVRCAPTRTRRFACP